MPSDDEFRRVAEDVRALARSLAREVREAFEGARHDPAGRTSDQGGSGTGWEARDELRRARQVRRQARRAGPYGQYGQYGRDGRWYQPPPGTGAPGQWGWYPPGPGAGPGAPPPPGPRPAPGAPPPPGAASAAGGPAAQDWAAPDPGSAPEAPGDPPGPGGGAGPGSDPTSPGAGPGSGWAAAAAGGAGPASATAPGGGGGPGWAPPPAGGPGPGPAWATRPGGGGSSWAAPPGGPEAEGRWGPPPPGYGWSGPPGAIPIRRAKQPKPPRPPLRHRRDGSTLLGLLVLVFGLAWLFAGTHLFRVSVEAVVALALMVLGGTMVITARTDWALSRRKWPVFLGVGLLLALAVGSTSARFPTLRRVSFGSATQVYPTWDQVPSVIPGQVGRRLVDLSQLPGPPPVDTTVTVDATGGLVVRLPPDVHTVLDVELAAGRILVNKIPEDTGFRPTYSGELSSSSPGATLTLRVNGIGQVVIDDTQDPPVTPAVPIPTPDPNSTETTA